MSGVRREKGWERESEDPLLTRSQASKPFPVRVDSLGKYKLSGYKHMNMPWDGFAGRGQTLVNKFPYEEK